MIAGMAGIFKDAAEASGLGFESPMLGRADFEQLEMQRDQDRQSGRALGEAAGGPGAAGGRACMICFPLDACQSNRR